MQTRLRVSLVGGATITRDLISNVLNEAGLQVIPEPARPTEGNEIVVLIAEDQDPARMLVERPARRTVLITDLGVDDESAVDFVLDGADAVVNFDASANELTTAVLTVAEGGSLLTPRAARRVSEIARSSRVSTANERAVLTSRELDILLSIGRGESVKQTARTLGISAKTVENLQSRLFRKLEVRNRAQAFAQAHAMGLIPAEEITSQNDSDAIQ